MVQGGIGAVRRAAASALDRVTTGLRAARRALVRFAPRPSAFAGAPDAEAAAVRVVRNIRTFRVHYAVLLWVLLLGSLAPHHRAAMLFLMAASKGLVLYGVLRRACAGCHSLIRRLLDGRLATVIFLGVVVGELTADGAVNNLLGALGIGVPFVLLHALLRTREDLEAAAMNGGDLPMSPAAVEKRDHVDLESDPSR